MTRPTFRPDPRRDTAAATLVQSAYCWPVLTLKVAVGAFRPGERFFAVPSSEPGRNYLANARFCACPDYQRRESGCKHQRAVLLHLAAIEGMEGADEAPQSARRPTCGVCTQELAPGILAGVCADCVEAGQLFDGVAAIKAAFGSDAGAVVRTIVA